MKTSLVTLAAFSTLLAHCPANEKGQKQTFSDRRVATISKASNKATAAATTKKDISCASFKIQATHEDSVLINKYLNDAANYYSSLSSKYEEPKRREQLIIHIARKLRGVPYVAKTLENDHEERLVINLRELDCTTYVENVLAIYLCASKGSTSIGEYIDNLRRIRYVDGDVSYATRQHYFTEWIEQNTKKGFVEERQSPNPPFSARQHVNINYMSTHVEAYPMLKNNKDLVKPIADMEKRLSGNTYMYIPKTSISNTNTFRSAIHDGDIIAITTKKQGLDTSHIGIAVWHNDGLHMLNASQIRKKVVEEPMTLYQYMQKHPSQTGIRIVRVK